MGGINLRNQLRAEINTIEMQTKGLVKLEVAALQNFGKSRKSKGTNISEVRRNAILINKYISKI